ncbi:hypothetical protein CRENBAI_018647 [Crenichthys baileyi]|uniref:Uncharacterized protein n=1 Tax=Crenichthys baileyi TaxID=28760 RepID=A0AAV9S4L5_9TELE
MCVCRRARPPLLKPQKDGHGMWRSGRVRYSYTEDSVLDTAVPGFNPNPSNLCCMSFPSLYPALYNNKNKGHYCHKMKPNIRFWPPFGEQWSPSGHPSEIFWLCHCM